MECLIQVENLRHPAHVSFAQQGLNKEDDRTIAHIEEFGCSVVQVKKTEYGLGWS